MPRLTFNERIQHCKNSTAQRLLKIVIDKKTNLVLSADKNKAANILKLADDLGPYLCMLKTHIDIVDDFSLDFIQQLKVLSEKHNFLIFEDRKFADIGNTVLHQYKNGIYHIAKWADIINAHIIAGPGSIEALRDAALQNDCAMLLVAQLSSAENLIVESYTHQAVTFAQRYSDFVIGFISQQKITSDAGLLHFTPGVKLQQGSDARGQRYRDPQYAIAEQGNDFIIVGRGIIEAENPIATCIQYRDQAWQALKHPE